jgi:hypothetical protein
VSVMTKAFPIWWHKDGLRNMKENLKTAENEHAQMITRLIRLRSEVELYEEQITEAERRGKKEFDRYRFMRPKKTP